MNINIKIKEISASQHLSPCLFLNAHIDLILFKAKFERNIFINHLKRFRDNFSDGVEN